MATSATTSVLGNMSEFNTGNDEFVEWVERLEQWFIANAIESDERKRALFLSLIGAQGYKLVRSLSQNEPAKKEYNELKNLMTQHLHPKPNEIAERYNFYNRSRKVGETIKSYVAELRRLSEHCNFGDKLNEHLRDKLVCGLNEQRIQQRLLAIKNLDLDTAIDTSIAMETAALHARDLHGTKSNVNVNGEEGGLSSIHKISSKLGKATVIEGLQSSGRRECFRCGSIKHLAEGCPFKTAECFKCRQVGHIRKKCRNNGTGSSSRVGRKVFSRGGGKSIYQADVAEEEDSGGMVESDMNFLALYMLKKSESSKRSNDPIMVEVGLNDCNVMMEVDTGAAVSVLSKKIYEEIGGGHLEDTKVKLKTYTGEFVCPEGIGKLNVVYDNQKRKLRIMVIDGQVPSLLGRDWLGQLKLHWDKLIPFEKVVHELEIEDKIEEMKENYSGVFNGKLGCLKDFKVNIPVPEGTKPIYIRPRSVPYSLRKRVDEELDKLEQQGVWEKVEYSNWAAPIVPVLKDKNDPGGPIRICGDYKMTVNKVAPLDNYPVPTTSEQLATLAGGEKFSKIDLSQAYQQLELDDSTRELLTISTQKGLYSPTRLQYGIHSATGIFQRQMEKLLFGIPGVNVRIDDVLVTGKDDVEHWRNLLEVVKRLDRAGLTVNLKKCKFLQDEVVFCGYLINKHGVKPMKENVEAVKKAPEPRNISELRSYLGMLNYYQNYLPGLATVSEPLHRLLRKGMPWKWEKEQSLAFEETKNMLSCSPVLVHFDPSLPIVVHADASPYGLGVVLSHVMPDGNEKPVSFGSRTLSPAERNYGHIEKEGLALVFAVKKLHHYLFGHQFTMVTDHKPLLGLFSEKSGLPEKSAARILRWALLLSGYCYKLEYRPGKLHANADGLSRLPLRAKEEDITQSIKSVQMMELAKSPVNEKEVSRETKKEPVLATVLTKVLNGWEQNDGKFQDELRPYCTRKEELTVEGGCVLWGCRVIIPKPLRKRVLEELHNGHIGVTRMKMLARSFFWWPNLDKEIEEMVRGCNMCNRNHSSPPAATLHAWEYPSGPWERIHLDFAGPFLGKMFLIVVDAFSKWLEVEMLNSSTSAITVSRLRRIFALHGLPQVVVTDNGPAFIGPEFLEFMEKNSIKHLRSAPYHPSSNGQAERMVRSFKEAMKCLQEGDIGTKLSRLLFSYRTTPSSVTGKSPAELLFNRQLRTAFDLLKPAKDSEDRKIRKEMQKSNKNIRGFAKQDLVWARNFGQGDKWVAGVVFRKLGSVDYEILLSDESKKKCHRHIDQLLARSMESCETGVELTSFDDVDVEGVELNGSKNEVVIQESKEQMEESTEKTSQIDSKVERMKLGEMGTSGHELRKSKREVKRPQWVSSNDYVMNKP